ncbi:hypothetical protein DPMN_193623 [Dreissena polymorpha]|uniref:Uncharacterized protein n=1 Tax=Dreissena polymorpha TaxID=45954 RepID=A0A9D3Y0K6_DREPO|nr:hypothetical protein DPMN_193623 [Dreissena polymorpha]
MSPTLFGECVRQIETPRTNAGVCGDDNTDIVKPRLKSPGWRFSTDFPDRWIGGVWSVEELQVVISAIGVDLQCKVCKVCKVYLETQKTSN